MRFKLLTCANLLFLELVIPTILLQLWIIQKRKKERERKRQRGAKSCIQKNKERSKIREISELHCILWVLGLVLSYLLAWTRFQTSLGQWYRLAWDYFSVLQFWIKILIFLVIILCLLKTPHITSVSTSSLLQLLYSILTINCAACWLW